jgi:hypothetical protein
LFPSLIENTIVKEPDVPAGGLNEKTFPDEVNEVQVGLSILIMLTV